MKIDINHMRRELSLPKFLVYLLLILAGGGIHHMLGVLLEVPPEAYDEINKDVTWGRLWFHIGWVFLIAFFDKRRYDS